MGNAIAKVVSGVAGSDKAHAENPDIEAEMKDQVDSLQREAEFDSKRFYNKILRSTHDKDHLIPISQVLYKYTRLEIVTETDNQSTINGAIQKIITSVTSSSVSGVVSAIIGSSVKALFGRKSLEFAEEEGYTISLGLLGGVERFDYRFVRRSFSDETWSNTLQSVVSITLVVSACDIQHLQQNDTKVIVQNCFSAISGKDSLNNENVALMNDLQISMHKLLSFEINLINAEIERKKKVDPIKPTEAEIDQQFAEEEELILFIDETYRKFAGLASKEAVEAVQIHIETLRARSYALAIHGPV